MIRSLRLERFKNFNDAELQLGSFTVLIGANASGKSNIRDAFRFLHGIGRGYSLAEILGEKYVGGERIWSGIRGGTREVAYWGSPSFEIGVDLDALKPFDPGIHAASYSTTIEVGTPIDKPPHVIDESLKIQNNYLFETAEAAEQKSLKVRFPCPAFGVTMPEPPTYHRNTSIILQVARENDPALSAERKRSWAVLHQFVSFRFLNLSPTQMRIPSLPGQTELGDRGENLSSVLSAICDDPTTKEALLEWVRKLTPMDVDDFRFDQDASGKILLSLREKSGRTISAMSASDGTLRFLAILAAIFGPTPASFYFIEELENGIHPTRLGLLVDLIEHQTKRRNIQVVATCHSPLLLQFLSEEALANASIVYRLPDRPDAQIKRLVEIPEALRVIKEQSVSLLHASSWFEDALNLTEEEEATPVTTEHGDETGTQLVSIVAGR